MLSAILRLLGIAFLALATIALGVFLWSKLSSERTRDLTPYEIELVDRVVVDVVDALPRREQVKRLLVMPVGGDELDGQVTDRLIDGLKEKRHEYDVVDARRYAGGELSPRDEEKALEVAAKLTQEAHPDGVLFSKVRRDVPRGGVGTEVALEARLIVLEKREESIADSARRHLAAYFPSLAPKAEAASLGEAVSAKERIDSRLSVDWIYGYVQQTSRFWRLLLWLVVAGAMPFLLHFTGAIHAAKRANSNQASALLVGSAVAVEVLAAWLLMGLRLGFGGVVLLLGATLAGGLYTLLLCNKIYDLT